MLLLDHFRPPLSTRRHWHSFHNAWATYLASDLNQRLPEGFFAEPNVQFGTEVQFGIEIDVAAFEENSEALTLTPSLASPDASVPGWQPPTPTQTIAFESSDAIVEVSILGSEGGPNLRAAIELASPANKDRLQQRNAFVSKCETYLREGIGLVIVDVVTTRQANLHQELLERFAGGSAVGSANLQRIAPSSQGSEQPHADQPPGFRLDGSYVGGYRSVIDCSSAERSQPSAAGSLQIWYECFGVGEALPTLPLWLGQQLCLPLLLQEAYAQTCRSQRLGN
ncbi:MAG: DUF4058 family protein [Synechococcales cyanobacterium CRU_2_2]|nr:DUF4058 family protein [Synechococcales cyanobacterium CRU_2_2]